MVILPLPAKSNAADDTKILSPLDRQVVDISFLPRYNIPIAIQLFKFTKSSRKSWDLWVL